jgi:hypothetical protein
MKSEDENELYFKTKQNVKPKKSNINLTDEKSQSNYVPFLDDFINSFAKRLLNVIKHFYLVAISN